MFDYGNVVEHFPTTNDNYVSGRDGDLSSKVYGGAYNESYLLSKHSPSHLRAIRLTYGLAVGSLAAPGLLATPFAIARFGAPRRELRLLMRTWQSRLEGWRDGARQRKAARLANGSVAVSVAGSDAT